MQELKFKNLIQSLFVFIVAIGMSAGSYCISTSTVDLPLPLLLIGLFAGYLVINFLAYPRATTAQILQLTITGVIINAGVLAAAIFVVKRFELSPVSLNSDFLLSISPLIPILSFIFSIFTLINLVKFENINNEAKKNQDKTEIPSEKKEDVQPETIPFEIKKTDTSIAEKSEVSIKVKEKPVEIQEIKEDEPKSIYEELYPQSKTEIKNAKEPEETELFFSLNENEQPEKIFETKEMPLNQEAEIIKLEPLPTISLEGVIQNNNISSASQIEEKEEPEENFDFIPTDIRLVEAPVSKDKESKGKIASIGKLLVNKRDIEVVIESNELNTEKTSESNTNIISSASGVQIYEKLNNLTEKYTHIKEIALIDKGGFALAGNYEDKMKIQITGALIAGAYHTLQNYLAQISFDAPEKIFFETENSNNFIIKTNDNLLFAIGEKDFKNVDFDVIEGIIDNEENPVADFTPLIELNQIIDFAVSDSEGKFISSSNNSGKGEKQAIISAALFENFKVFLMNIQLVKLKRIVFFCSNKVITIQKYNNQIISFITPEDGLVRVSEKFPLLQEIL